MAGCEQEGWSYALLLRGSKIWTNSSTNSSTTRQSSCFQKGDHIQVIPKFKDNVRGWKAQWTSTLFSFQRRQDIQVVQEPHTQRLCVGNRVSGTCSRWGRQSCKLLQGTWGWNRTVWVWVHRKKLTMIFRLITCQHQIIAHPISIHGTESHHFWPRPGCPPVAGRGHPCLILAMWNNKCPIHWMSCSINVSFLSSSCFRTQPTLRFAGFVRP